MLNLGIKTNNEIDQDLAKRFDHEAVSKSVITYGSRPPKNGDVNEWANSALDEPLPLRYELLPIDQLFTSEFMGELDVSYEKIRQALKTFLDKYCSTQKDDLGISSCDGPSAGCSGGHVCHYNAHCEDVAHEDTLTSYECVCNDGYFGNGFMCSGWNIQNNLLTDVIGEGGNGYWKDVELCPKETYANRFALKVEPDQGTTQDDSALNGVKLYCTSFDHKKSGEVTSGVGKRGSWKSPLECSRGFFNGLRFKAMDGSTSGDSGGANVDMACNSGINLQGDGMNGEDWGPWSSRTYCPPESAVCGIQTKIDNPSESCQMRRFNDESGLTNIKVICCKI